MQSSGAKRMRAGFAVLRREANEGGFFRPIVKVVVEILRVFFKFNRRLLGDLCRCALRSLSRYFEAAALPVLMETMTP